MITLNPRQQRLATMRQLLDSAFANHLGNDRQQRLVLNRIAVEANYAGVAPLEYLKAYFLGAATAAAPAPTEDNPIVCPACQKTFKSQTALNGHGPERCALKTIPT